MFLAIGLILTAGVVSAALFDLTGNTYNSEFDNVEYGVYDPDNELYIQVDRGADPPTAYIHDDNWNHINTQTLASTRYDFYNAMDYYDGYVWAADGDNNIYYFDSTGTALLREGSISTSGICNDPQGLEFTDNYMYVSCSGSVHQLDHNGNYISEISGSIDGGGMAYMEQINNKIYIISREGYRSEFNLTNPSASFQRNGSISVQSSESLTGGFLDVRKGLNYFWSYPTTTVWEYEGEVTSAYLETFLLEGYVTDRDRNGIKNVQINTNASYSTQSNPNGYYNISVPNGTYEVTASKTGYNTDSAIITVNGANKTQNFRLIPDDFQLDLQIQNYMEHGSRQPYRVEYRRVTSDGNIVSTLVTEQANLSSDNTNVISIDNQNNELVATDNRSVADRVNITAEYTTSDGTVYQTTKNVTVANNTIENIGIMPGSQFIGAFLNIGKGLGTEIQWLFLIITFGAVMARLSRNEWIGLGAISMSLIITWLMGYVSVGIMMISLLFAIAMALILIDIPSRYDTNITVEAPTETDGFNDKE